jgi:uncharacterized protein
VNAHLPYIGPFLVFIGLLSVQSYLAPLGRWEYPLRVFLLAGVIWYFSRRVLSFRCVAPVMSVLIGLGVIVVWVLPDVLIPGYREHWLFQNSLMGKLKTSIEGQFLDDPLVLFFRTMRAVVIVPIVEELFWRAWMMRWLIKPDFEQVPLGTYELRSFLITAALFASEHGPYWEVGLICGLVFNWWMVKTKSLGDLILAHAVANLALSLYTIYTKQWQYWL